MHSGHNADIAVLGAGPAGAIAARVLSSAGADVLLVGRERPPLQVGEGLPASALPLLESLGLADVLKSTKHLPSFGTQSSWGADRLLTKDSILSTFGHGWQLDRSEFDRALVLSAVASGTSFLPNSTFQHVCRQSKAFKIALTANQRTIELSADLLIDCTGRSAHAVRQFGGVKHHLDRLVAVVAWLKPAFADDSDSTITTESVRDGWWYTSRIPCGSRVLVYLTDADCLDKSIGRSSDKFMALALLTKYVSRSIKRYEYRMIRGPRVLTANSGILAAPCGPGWIAAGDACMSFDPLSGNGIVTALVTGRWAAEAMLSHSHAVSMRGYCLAARETYEAYVAERTTYYSLERRWPRSLFWQRRIAG